jgi:hypothetical protein
MNEPFPEFSRVISIARISPKGVEKLLEAKPSECVALAKRFDLIEIPRLAAQLTLIPGSQQTVAATGIIKAEVVQRCVVTLEPVVSRLTLDVDVIFAPAELNPVDNQEPLRSNWMTKSSSFQAVKSTSANWSHSNWALALILIRARPMPP